MNKPQNQTALIYSHAMPLASFAIASSYGASEFFTQDTEEIGGQEA